MLNQKKALITGGTRGIGRAIAECFAKHGASVIIFGTNEEKAKEVIASMQASAPNPTQEFSYSVVDVSDHKKVIEIDANYFACCCWIMVFLFDSL